MKGRKNRKAIFFYDKMLDQDATTVRIMNPSKGTTTKLDSHKSRIKDGLNKTIPNPETVIKGFYRDDFHISITNQWQTGGSSIVKSLVDTAANMLTSRMGKVIAHYAQTAITDMKESGELDAGGIDSSDKLAGTISQIQKYQNSAYFTADDFFKSFKGTTVTFPTNIQITLVSDEWNPDEDIFDKLKRLMDVSVGDYGTDKVSGWVGIQQAPNGFKTGGMKLSEEVSGTLNVVYGDPDRGGYIIKNMVISNLHFTFSKTKVKIGEIESSVPTKNEDGTSTNKVVVTGIYRPLYIDIQIMLEPAQKYTKKDIIDTIGSAMMQKYTTAGENFELKPELTETEEKELIKEGQSYSTEKTNAEKKAEMEKAAELYIQEYIATLDGDVKDANLSAEYNPETKELIINGTASGYHTAGTDSREDFLEWLNSKDGLGGSDEVSKVTTNVKMKGFNNFNKNTGWI